MSAVRPIAAIEQVEGLQEALDDAASSLGRLSAVGNPEIIAVDITDELDYLLRDAIRVGDTYYMYDEYYDASTTIWSSHVRTSADGMTWSAPSPALFGPGEAGAFDETGQADPTVVYVGPGEWVMFFDAKDGDNNWVGIGRATSADGLTWEKDTDPVLVIGEGGEWDDDFIHHPCVIIHDGVWHMYYSAMSAAVRKWSIGHATSADGLTWEKHGQVLLPSASGFDSADLRPARPIVVDGVWTMFYWATEGPAGALLSSMGRAESPDGFTWEKKDQALDLREIMPVYDIGPMATAIIEDDGCYRMYISARGTNYGYRTLLAALPVANTTDVPAPGYGSGLLYTDETGLTTDHRLTWYQRLCSMVIGLLARPVRALSVAGGVDIRSGGLIVRSAPAPSAIRADVLGDDGSTSREYRICSVDATGDSQRSSAVTVADGPAALNADDAIRISWKPVEGASAYKVYRTVSNGTPSTTGLIAIVTDPYVVDNGIEGDGTSPLDGRRRTGRTGLGTDAPVAQLHVQNWDNVGTLPTFSDQMDAVVVAGMNTTLQIVGRDTDTIGLMFSRSRNSPSRGRASIVCETSNSNLIFRTGGLTERARIDDAGRMGIGGAPASTAILDLTSTALGFLPPRMTTVQRDAITSPAEGLCVYNSTAKTLDYYNGTAWVQLGGS